MYSLKYINSDGLEIDLNYNNDIAISRTIGLTGNINNYNESQAFNHVGTAIERFSTASKEIEINGEIIGNTLNKKQQITRAITPLKRGTLYFNDIFFIDVVPVKSPTFEQFRYNAKFSIVLKAPYPFWRYKDVTTLGLGYFLPRFKFPVNYAVPHRFGEKIETNIYRVNVNGDIASDINYTFMADGYVKNPKVINVETGEFIRLNIDLLIGDEIRVYRDLSRLLRVELIREELTTDVFYALDEESRLFTVDAGENILELKADEGINAFLVKIEIYDTYLGVYDGLQRLQPENTTTFID